MYKRLTIKNKIHEIRSIKIILLFILFSNFQKYWSQSNLANNYSNDTIVVITTKENKEIRGLVKKYNIPVSEELLLVADKCVEKKVEYNKSTDWADIQIPKLNKIESILIDSQNGIKNDNITEFNSVIRALDYLKKYIFN